MIRALARLPKRAAQRALPLTGAAAATAIDLFDTVFPGEPLDLTELMAAHMQRELDQNGDDQ